MKAYLTRVLAILAAAFSAQATVSNQAKAQDPTERQAWSTALTDGSVDAFKDYLARYPIGAYSREAFARIIQLSPEPDVFGDLDQTRSSVENEAQPPATSPSPLSRQDRLGILDRRLEQY
ncbi:MAG: hypothetical protein ACR2RA_26340 [Geminicoccaceae bacterium]